MGVVPFLREDAQELRRLLIESIQIDDTVVELARRLKATPVVCRHSFYCM
jgi:hypothetical protein